MRRVVIVQARMSSTRLPGKVLAEVSGRSMLAHQLSRLRECRAVDDVLVATTTGSGDDAVVALARAEGIPWFRGSESDVLSRYVGAAREARADVVVRVTADCPLIDPVTVDAVVRSVTDPADPCDYASNTVVRTFPRGLDAEAFHVDVLCRMHRMATSAPSREHVTYYLHRERPELFVRRDVVQARDDSDLRWTVDTEDDLALIRRIHALAGLPDRRPSFDELVDLVRRTPELMAMNAHVRQKGE